MLPWSCEDSPRIKAFETTKESSASTTALALYKTGCKTVVSADSSSFGIGAVIMQKTGRGVEIRLRLHHVHWISRNTGILRLRNVLLRFGHVRSSKNTWLFWPWSRSYKHWFRFYEMLWACPQTTQVACGLSGVVNILILHHSLLKEHFRLRGGGDNQTRAQVNSDDRSQELRSSMIIYIATVCILSLKSIRAQLNRSHSSLPTHAMPLLHGKRRCGLFLPFDE